MNVPDLLTRLRLILDTTSTETTAGSGDYFQNAELVEYLDAEHAALCEIITQVDSSFLFRKTTLTLIAGTDAYDLPFDCKVLLGVGSQNVSGVMPPLSPSEVVNYIYTSGAQSFYYLRGRQIVMLSTPTQADTLDIFYWKEPVVLSYGVPTAVGATVMVLNTSPTGGRTIRRADYYNDEWIEIVSGTGAGQVRRVSDYSVACSATVATWTTTPAITSVYSILPDTPPSLDNTLVEGAAIRALEREGIFVPATLRERYIVGVQGIPSKMARADVRATPHDLSFLSARRPPYKAGAFRL